MHSPHVSKSRVETTPDNNEKAAPVVFSIVRTQTYDKIAPVEA